MTQELPFAARVSEGMSRRGLTLRGLCREAGLDPSFFSKVLSGKRSPPSEEPVLRRIAQVIGIEAPELIVAAGRIPSEWRALWKDEDLFREVSLRVSGQAPRAAERRARPSPVLAPVLQRRPDLSTELL